MRLPILANELRLPLDDAGLPGVVAVVRPLDVEEAARWHDAFGNEMHFGSTACVKQQLIRLEGLTMYNEAGNEVPFSMKDELHFRSLPAELVTYVFTRLYERTRLQENAEKNSDSPSVSGGTSSSAVSPAAPAAR